MKRRKTGCLLLGCLFVLFVLFEKNQNIWAAQNQGLYQSEKFSDFHNEALTLYAKGAVLIDCDSQRILYGKNANTPMANASTTKILTCILALEEGNLQDVVTMSAYACKMPKVRLGCTAGDQFYLKDLLYSLMLESHNDAAAAIAEHIAGSVELFAEKMNEKAAELGCKNSHFVTPNGLDGKDAGGVHAATAYDLSRIMSYCIQNKTFLEITQTASRQIQNVAGTKTYALQNHNALLNMLQGVISGKTGFTGDAGYCYVGAYQKDGKTFAFALLACGWPNNKSYKWSDARKLIAYGNENYETREITGEAKTFRLDLAQAVAADDSFSYPKQISAAVRDTAIEMLLSKEDVITVDYDLPQTVFAPAESKTVIGQEKIYLNQCLAAVRDVYLTERAQRFDFSWCLRRVFENACL